MANRFKFMRLVRDEATTESPPPWPHNPAERVVVEEIAGWEARVVPRCEPTHKFLLQQELLQLQLWHPRARVSLLTPSPAIRGCPVHSIGGWIVLNATETHVRNVVRLSFGLRFPSKGHLEALVRWFVLREYRSAKISASEALRNGPRSFELAIRRRAL